MPYLSRLVVWVVLVASPCLATDKPAGEKRPDDSSLKEAAKQTPQRLDPVVVAEDSTLSFGLSLKILKSNITGRVMMMSIVDLDADCDAAVQHLSAGTLIQVIDGKPVGEFDATFKPGSDLRRLLMQRKPGDKVILEVVAAPGAKPKKVTLIEHPVRIHVRTGTGPSTIEDADRIWTTRLAPK